MAIITVNNSGGSIALGTTYVGGVAPTNIDSIAFTATSGQLDVDSVLNIAGIDFTNCVSNINFTQPINLNNTLNTHFVNLGLGGYALLGTPEIKYANTVNGATLSLTSNGTSWAGVLNLACSTQNNFITLVDTWNQDGEFKTAPNVQVSFLGNTFNINGLCNGDGSGALQFSEFNTAIINLNGNVTLSVGLGFDGGTLNYIGGTCDIPAVFCSPSSSLTLNIDGVTTIPSTVSIVPTVSGINVNLTSKLKCDLLSLDSVTSGVFNFGGSFGFEAESLSIGVFTPPEIVFVSAVEYKVNSSINITNVIFRASIPGVKALLTLGQNINQIRVTAFATDIDSSNGRRVNNFFGTVVNCDNWRIFNDTTLPQIPSVF